MAKLVFLQRQVSQLDEPVYARINKLAPGQSHVIYWNDYGFERTHVDPEMGLTPQMMELHKHTYERTWLDTNKCSVQEVFATLLALKPHIVVLADIPSRTRALLALKLRAGGIEVALRSDKSHLSKSAKNGMPLAIERVMTRLIYNVLAPISPLSQRYYDWPEKRRCPSFPYCTNERKFSPPDEHRAQERRSLRTSLGIADDHHLFVSAAKFVERENPWDLIKAYEKVRAQRPNTSLVALGDGPDLEDIKAYCQAGQIKGIFFPGYVPFAQLQNYFFAADSFLHFARTEPWGVSPQDALIAGLGLLTSSRVGSAQVMLQGPLRRFVVSLEQKELFVERMIELCDSPDVVAMFKDARNNAQDYTVASCAQRWVGLFCK